MPKIIDHDRRKEEILKTALSVFSKVGYKDANLSLIAHECGISRPTIYQYFHDKEEIYYYAVKLVTGSMFRRYADIAWDNTRTVVDRLHTICVDIITTASENRGALTSLVDVMIQLKKEDRDFSDIIMRRTAKLTILFRRMLRHGIEIGELRRISDRQVSEHLMLLLESFCFQMAFLDSYDPDSSVDLVYIYIDSLKV